LYASAPEWRKAWLIPGASPSECLDMMHFGASQIHIAP